MNFKKAILKRLSWNVVGLLLIGWSFSSYSDSASTTDSYFSPTLQIRFARVADWTIDQQGQTVTLSPDTTDVFIQIVRTEGQKPNLTDLWKAPLVPGSRRTFITLNSLKALREENSAESSTPYHDHYIVVRENSFYTLDFNSPRLVLSSVKPTFEKILASLQWTDVNGQPAFVALSPAAAIDQLRARADAGDMKAQLDLGAKYQKGAGVPQDDAEAVRWFQKAADQGYNKAYYDLGVMYFHGYGGVGNSSLAWQWLQKAADTGLSNGQYMIGVRFEDGYGVPQSYFQAKKWYALAAANGSSEARQALDGFTQRYFMQSVAIKKIDLMYGTPYFATTLLGYLAPFAAIGLILLILCLSLVPKSPDRRRWTGPWAGGLLFAFAGMVIGAFGCPIIPYLLHGGDVHDIAFGPGPVVLGMVGYLVGWSILTLRHYWKSGQRVGVSDEVLHSATKPARVYLVLALFFLLAPFAWYLNARYVAHLGREVWSERTTPADYLAIAQSPWGRHNEYLANELGRNPRTPMEALLALRGSPAWTIVAGWVAKRGDAPADLIDQMARDPDISIRQCVAQNPALKPDLARILAKENDVDIRMSLVQNPGTPLDVLQEMEQNDPASRTWIERYIQNRKSASGPFNGIQGRPNLMEKR